MSIIIAENAGFCFGVDRAVKIIYDLVKQNKKICTLGPVVHNSQVINNMKKSGVLTVASPEEVPKGYTLVIRAHGVSKNLLKRVQKLNINYVDATCPFVNKIHKIVQNDKYDVILIFGNENHPEVDGIIGNCNSKCYVIANSVELENFIESNEFNKNSKILVVEQTTFNINEWKKCLSILKNSCTNCKIFDTICNTTQNRQVEAMSLAKKSDLAVVIGSKESSNTMKLKNICEKYCRTILVEDAKEISENILKKAKKICIIAGASTPAYVILEVKRVMEKMLDKNNEVDVESSFEEMLEESLKNMDTSSRVKGIVVNITPSEVYVDIGRKHAGFIPVSELSSDPNAKCEDIVKIGDELDLLILKTNDQDGTMMLSKKKVDNMKGLEEIVNAEKDKTILSGTVSEVVKGGIIVLCKGIKVFIPASLATLSRKEPLEELKGKAVNFRIIEVNKQKRRIVGSIRSVLEEKREKERAEFFEKVQIGDKLKGKVVSFTPYGAFVDLGGVDGMIHTSELAWTKVKHPSNVLSIGQDVEVMVVDIDKEKGKVALSYKYSQENPWDILKRDYSVGSIIDVTIVGLTDFGAFAKIIPGIDGLIHVSQISKDRINHPKDVLSIGDIVKAKITDLDFDNCRVGLSIKALDESFENE